MVNKPLDLFAPFHEVSHIGRPSIQIIGCLGIFFEQTPGEEVFGTSKNLPKKPNLRGYDWKKSGTKLEKTKNTSQN